MKNLSFKSVLKDVNSHLARVLVPWIIRHPKYLVASRCLVRGYRRSLELIDAAMLEDLQVPPFLILSITNNCNLHCSGCYAAAVGTLESTTGSNKKKALNTEQWHKIIDEAIDLGVFGFIIAGGEPFLFPDLLDLIEEHNSNFFLIFSNGTAIKKSHYARLKKLANVGVIVSIEGGQFLTDNRRGEGVYAKALKTILQLKKQGTLSGISVTINKLNYEYWLDPENIDNLISDGV
jgi:MoaA/NifB/PqqE/SkfB family radical SAM enzyme